MLERDIEAHLVERVRELGGEIRKVKWIGRRGAPDRVVMLPNRIVVKQWDGKEFGPGTICATKTWHAPAATIWVELKNPKTILTFPANAHERAQHREHERMRKMGQRVEVIGTIEAVEELLP